MRTPSTSEALASFMAQLRTGAHGVDPHNAPELLDRWSINMETQINVIPLNGVPVEGKKGCFEDPNTGFSWWNLRIPKGAATGVTHFQDKPLPWPPIIYASGIGCTGWDWQNKVSKWVGFDFDSITGHAKGVGVEEEELHRVREAVQGLAWVEVRRSTGGQGLHLYVLLDNIPIENHTDHTALARCVLAKMTRETGFDFASSIDACGGNMWQWHRKMTTANQGLKLLKPAESTLSERDLSDWKNFRQAGKRSRVRVGEDVDAFDRLTNEQASVDLDDDHRATIQSIRDASPQYACEWIPDHNCLQTHTKALEEIPHRGVFRTISEGKDISTPNCFAFPRPHGGWIVFRFSPGTAEDPTWEQDNEGWTRCEFNVEPTFDVAAKASGGKLDESGAIAFDKAVDAVEMARLLGAKVPLSHEMEHQEAIVRTSKATGSVVVEVTDKSDGYVGDMRGWVKKKKRWIFTTTIKPAKSSGSAFEASRSQFFLCEQDGRTCGIRRYHAGMAYPVEISRAELHSTVSALLKGGDASRVVDAVTEDIWKLECVPFKPFVDRERKVLNVGAQLAVKPEPGPCPTWHKVLLHAGSSLTEPLTSPGQEWSEWARSNNVTSGGQFLLNWCGWLFQSPEVRVPALAFFGMPDNGKSTFPDSLQDLLSSRGTSDARTLLTKNSHFTGSVATSVLTRVEEDDCSGKSATATLKHWITAPRLTAEFKGCTPYSVVNCLHFIMTVNNPAFVPVFDRDNRVVVIEAPPLIDKDIHIVDKLRAEAPAFVHLCLSLNLPPRFSRLALPPISTAAKDELAASNRSAVEEFAEECLIVDPISTAFIANGEVFDRYCTWCREKERPLTAEDASALARELRSWFSHRGVPAARSKASRGRTGLTLLA